MSVYRTIGPLVLLFAQVAEIGEDSWKEFISVLQENSSKVGKSNQSMPKSVNLDLLKLCLVVFQTYRSTSL